MDVTTATRFHLGEHVGSSLLRLGLIPLLGFDVWNLAVYDGLLIGIIMFHHADISIGRWDRWLRLLIVTPFMHKVHHSDWRPETDSILLHRSVHLGPVRRHLPYAVGTENDRVRARGIHRPVMADLVGHVEDSVRQS